MEEQGLGCPLGMAFRGALDGHRKRRIVRKSHSDVYLEVPLSHSPHLTEVSWNSTGLSYYITSHQT